MERWSDGERERWSDGERERKEKVTQSLAENLRVAQRV
jgi:hypothetical protein